MRTCSTRTSAELRLWINTMRPAASDIINYFRLDPETGNVYPVKCRIKRFRTIPVGKKETDGYIRIKYKGKYYSGAVIVWILFTGDWPKGEIDHINRCRSDNRPCNLRDVSRYENEMNKERNVSRNVGLPGISIKHTGRYYVEKHGKYLGSRDTLADAIALYNAPLD